MSQRKPMVVGNWKMNGGREEVTHLVRGVVDGVCGTDKDCLQSTEVVLGPSFPYLSLVAEMLVGTGVQLSAQDASEHEVGAYTGEVAAAMLADCGCQYVLVGHSERRTYWSETNERVARKFLAVQRHGMVPVLCVGETLEEREAGMTEQVVRSQLEAVLRWDGADFAKGAIIAYEPVWAIGTGRQATPEQAQEVHVAIRSCLAQESVELAGAVKVLYGGSVNQNSARDLFLQPDIDGALVGGASLDPVNFSKIALAAAESQG